MDGAQDALVLRLTWALEAPRERVFDALTDPQAVARWWGPEGFTAREVELDPTVGGRYRFGMQPPEGELFHLAGRFLAVEPPRRLAFSFNYEEPDPDDRETVVDLLLEEAGGRTAVRLAQGGFATEARLELHRHGWTDSFARLQRLLAPTG